MLKRLMMAGLVTAACAVGAQAQLAPDSHTATLKGLGGVPTGKVIVTGTPHGVIVRIEAAGLTPGWHGIHFHEKGDCSDSAFKNSGGHVHNAMPVVHGLLNSSANDLGDLPNIFVGSDGKVTVELYSNYVSLRGDTNKPALLDKDGSALVIHAKPDDYQSQPIGGAGDRVACAVIG